MVHPPLNRRFVELGPTMRPIRTRVQAWEAVLDGRKYARLQSHRAAHYGRTRAGYVGSSPAYGRPTDLSGIDRPVLSVRAPSAGGALGLPCTPQGHPRGQHARGYRLHYARWSIYRRRAAPGRCARLRRPRLMTLLRGSRPTLCK
jgi:hypothetical protein